MCVIGEQKERVYLKQENGVVGYRGFIIKGDVDGPRLYGLVRSRIPLTPREEKSDKQPTLKNENGLWAFDSYDSNNNYNYNSNYYNYNYNYNNNYNSYNYYNNKYHNNYYVAAKILGFGYTVLYKDGFRANKLEVLELVRLTPNYDLSEKFNDFLTRFNSIVDRAAQLYGAKVVNHIDFK